MNSNINVVKELYSSGNVIEDMKDYTKKRLKIWEKEALYYFPKGARILDIGCGMGREAFCLHNEGFKVIGIDISEEVIEPAKRFALKNNIGIEFLVTNGLDLSFEDNSFDVVIIWSQTFGLFYGEKNKLRILNECKRVLKNGGVLSFSGHDREFLEREYSRYLQGEKFFAYANTECY